MWPASSTAIRRIWSLTCSVVMGERSSGTHAPEQKFLSSHAGRSRNPVSTSARCGLAHLVLNERAKAALEDSLSRFGQLLELEVDGSTEWLYNVTHVIDCIDLERSGKRLSGTIAKKGLRGGEVANAASDFQGSPNSPSEDLRKRCREDLVGGVDLARRNFRCRFRRTWRPGPTSAASDLKL